MSLVLQSSGGGQITIQEPATASNFTQTLPAATGNVILDTATQTLTNKTIEGGTVISGTAVASTSGTSIDFTSIPSWVKRITLLMNQVSTNGSSVFRLQLGTSSGVTTSGYYGNVVDSGGTTRGTYTDGFSLALYGNASYTFNGTIFIQNISSNVWMVMGTIGPSAADAGGTVCGGISLAATLDRVRLTTVNGTDTFDNGNVNILYE